MTADKLRKIVKALFANFPASEACSMLEDLHVEILDCCLYGEDSDITVAFDGVEVTVSL